MKSTRLVSMVLAIVFLLLLFAACRFENITKNESIAAVVDSGIYNMKNYENEEVFGIHKVYTGGKYEKICTTYVFTYMSDGLKIEGYMSIPRSIEQTQKPGKCVMYNHGGNRALGNLENNTTAAVCAICDRIVIASQYRGCGSSEGKDDFGGDGLNDVINLMDLCENHFSFVDMDDFCVIGVSRGGVMTYPAARMDDRIKRIITLSAVSDLFESFKARDDMQTVLKETIGCTPEENPDEYIKRSAMYWADEIKVPVLMFHAKQDKQVPYSQAENLYAKFKDSIDCTLITYDDDSHAAVKPEDYKIIRDWLDQ